MPPLRGWGRDGSLNRGATDTIVPLVPIGMGFGFIFSVTLCLGSEIGAA